MKKKKKKLSLEQKKKIISEMPLDELKMRRQLINSAIRMCIAHDDPYDAIPVYREQLNRIESAIRNKKPKPKNDAVSIKANVGRIGAKTARQLEAN